MITAMENIELVEIGPRTWMNDRFELKVEFDRYWVIKPFGEKSICYAERNGYDCPINGNETGRKSDSWWCIESGIWKKAQNFIIECNF